MSIDRRAFLAASAALVLAGCAPRDSGGTAETGETPPPRPSPTPTPTPLGLDLSDLPSGAYGVWGTWGGRVVTHDADRRLRLCSTMKLPLAALVLVQDGEGALRLDETLTWSSADLVGHSPVTRARPGSATIAELAEAAARTSDNTAANLLLERVGGPAALTAYARSLGDDVTRFDRYELSMNTWDGDLDTTTAEAFGRLVLAIAEEARGELIPPVSWLPGRDGRRIGAAAPGSLDLAHKTGTSGDGALNDVALLLHDGRVAGCLSIFTDSPAESEETVVEIARRAFTALGI